MLNNSNKFIYVETPSWDSSNLSRSGNIVVMWRKYIWLERWFLTVKCKWISITKRSENTHVSFFSIKVASLLKWDTFYFFAHKIHKWILKTMHRVIKTVCRYLGLFIRVVCAFKYFLGIFGYYHSGKIIGVLLSGIGHLSLR